MYLFPVAMANCHKVGSFKKVFVAFLEARDPSLVFLGLSGSSRENQFLLSLYFSGFWLIATPLQFLKNALSSHSLLLGVPVESPLLFFYKDLF